MDYYHMLGEAMERLVNIPHKWLPTIYDLFEKLLSKAGPDWMEQLKRFLRQEECFVKEKKVFFTDPVPMMFFPDTTINLETFFCQDNALLSFDRSQFDRYFSFFSLVGGLAPLETICCEMRELKMTSHRVEFENYLPKSYRFTSKDFFCLLASEIVRASEGKISELLGDGRWRSVYIPRFRVSFRWDYQRNVCTLIFEKDGGEEPVGRIIFTRVASAQLA